MIPSIQEIFEMLLDGKISFDQAETWVRTHVANAVGRPLTNEKVYALANEHLHYQSEDYEVSGIYSLARAIEAAHGITGEQA